MRAPDAFDSLAAISRFIGVEKSSPEFYQRHYHPVEMACAFVRVLAGHYPKLGEAFRQSLLLPVSQGSQPIRDIMPTLGLTEERIIWFDAQMTEILKALVPVARDPSMPEWLQESKWAIEGAFQ